MPKRSYDIPGVQATILDYQIVPAPITDPGEIVVLLGDLPDTIAVEDPKNPGQIIDVIIPANQPILINQKSDLGVISGADLVNALKNLSGEDRHLEIVNVLPMLSSELPLAICKIIRRNGERPNSDESLQVYEALEYAYEGLANYPAGRVVPMPISAEDAVIDINRAIETEIHTGVDISVDEIDKIGGSIISDTSTVNFAFTTYDDSYKNNVSFKLTPFNDNGFLSLKIEGIKDDTGDNFFTMDMPVTESKTGNQSPVEILNYMSDAVEALLLMHENAKTIDENSGPIELDEASTDLIEAEMHRILLNDTNVSDTTLSIQNYDNFSMIEPSIFYDPEAVLGSPVQCDDINLTVVSNTGVNIGSLSIGIILSNNENILYTPTGDYSFIASAIDEGDYLETSVVLEEIIPNSWFYEEISTGSFLPSFVDSAGGATPLDYTRITSNPPKVDTSVSEPAAIQLITMVYDLLAIDRRSSIIQHYDLLTEERSNQDVLLEIPTETNLYVTSAFISLEGFIDDYNGDPAVVIDGVNYSCPGIVYTPRSANGEVVLPEDAIHYRVEEDYELTFSPNLVIRFLAGCDLPSDTNGTFELEITIIPAGAKFDDRLVKFCFDLTTDLNDCASVLGTIPPKTTSSIDIESQVDRLYNSLHNKNYSTSTVDNGLYLTVTTGSQKVSNTGGITNFIGSRVSAFDKTNVTVDLIGSLEFVIGDNVDLEIIKKGRYFIQENIVEDVLITSQGFQLTLKHPFDKEFGNVNNNSTRTCYLTNTKDRKGSYLAALYAVEANNYGIDKAPFNYTLPGASEVFYTRSQLTKLLDSKITPINRNAFNTQGVVIDTPTMARDESDFTDQGTVGLIFYFIRQMRVIANARKGERFAAGDRQIVFQTELEAPFVGELGDTIEAYDLQLDWTRLNVDHTLDVTFSIREAKKLKFVTITAKLF